MFQTSRLLVLIAAFCFVGLSLAQPLASKESRDIVVVSRGGVSVSLHEVDAQVMALPKALRAGYLDSPERLEQVIYGLLINKQLAKQAIDAGVRSDPFFETQLAAAEEEWLARRARNLHQDELLKDLPDFEALAEEIYLSHPHRFRRPVTLKLGHILVRLGGRGEEAARGRAEAARAAMLARDREFMDIYFEFSDEANDSRALGGGILTDVVPGVTEKPFEEAAFELKEVGQVSGVIRTDFGFHVVSLIERDEPTPQTWDEVKGTLAAEQQQRYMSEQKGRQLAELQSEEPVANPIVVAQLRSRYSRAAEGLLAPAIDGSEETHEEPNKTPDRL